MSEEEQKQQSKMSSLSRRACYKCGNVGHYAEVCSSSERLCYNCKQPGMLNQLATFCGTAHVLTAVLKAMRAITARTHGRLIVSYKPTLEGSVTLYTGGEY